MALLRFTLPDGRPATASVREGSTNLAVDGVDVSTWDACGRPLILVRGERTYRRAMSGMMLEKHRSTATCGGKALRRVVPIEEGNAVIEAAREDAARALRALLAGGPDAAPPEAVSRLRSVVAMDLDGLERDTERFRRTYRPVGMLPPDRYLSLVLQGVEGCSWNACTFCDLYRETSFHVKTPDEFADHVRAVRCYMGEALALRRSVFLGDANALCAARSRILPLLEMTAREFPMEPVGLGTDDARRWRRDHPNGMRGIYSFVDAWTGQRIDDDSWRSYAALGLRRVYVGLETGDAELLAWLEKAGTPDDAVDLVRSLHRAGVAAGVIVLLGAGGRRFAGSHVRRTAEVLTRMELRGGDLLFFSEFVDRPGLEYGRRASSGDLRPLGPRDCDLQRKAIGGDFRPAPGLPPPRQSVYDIRVFVY